jgi:hypothetical protein
MDMHKRNITSVQDIIGQKQCERNEEWYDQDCREITEVKRDARMNCIQCSQSRANQEDYNRKRIAAATVCHRKKRELQKTKVDEIVEYHTKNESKKYYKRNQELAQEFKPRVV